MDNNFQDVEWSLIEGKWRSNLPQSSPESSPIRIAQDVVNGKFSEVLKSPIAQELLAVDGDITNLAHILRLKIDSIPDEAERELVTLVIGVACLHAFIQENWTGPDLDLEPLDLLTPAPIISAQELNRVAVGELSYAGEPAYHLTKKAALLRFAQSIFALPYQSLHSSKWWNLRATTIHQHLLDEPVALPPSFFTPLEPLLAQLQEQPDLAGRLILEQGLLHHTFASDRIAAELFVAAARTFGLEYELTGAMGKRTKFQQTELSQLILLAQSRSRDDDDEPAGEPVTSDPSTRVVDETEPSHKANVPANIALNDDTLLEQTQFTSSAPGSSSSTSRLSNLDPSAQPPLHPLDQCILLSLCLNVRNTQPLHGLTSEQMSPYVSRVISHPRNWSIHTMSLLIRSRLESTRTRTVERSTLQLQALIDQMPTADSSLPERLLYFHSIPLPSKWEMERELANRYLSLGVVKSALEIFERLEMWEEVVQCWQSMERPEKGIIIVRDLLEGRKEEADTVLARGKSALESRREKMDSAREAKLWCLLGDLEPTSCFEHYTKALDVSHNSSARASRSLGGYHFSRNEFDKAITCLRQAVAISPLLTRTWFILGCAYVREERWSEARDAFTRCVSIDEDDSESWNNLASVYMQMGVAEKPQSITDAAETEDADVSDLIRTGNAKQTRVPFENKMFAFRALKRGLHFSYENWRMWQNYMIVSVDVGELAEACRALGRIVEELAGKEGEAAVDIDVLERLVNAVARAPNSAQADSEETPPETNYNEGHGLFPRVLDLFTRSILPRISTSPRIFQAYARLLVWQQNRWGDVVEAHMNAYRCSVVGDDTVETDLERWREAVIEVEEVVDVLTNYGPKVGGPDDLSGQSSLTRTRAGALQTITEGSGSDSTAKKEINWKFQARSIVRTFMGRTKGPFGDEPEWEKLTTLLDDLKN